MTRFSIFILNRNLLIEHLLLSSVWKPNRLTEKGLRNFKSRQIVSLIKQFTAKEGNLLYSEAVDVYPVPILESVPAP